MGIVLAFVCYLNHIKHYKHRSVTLLETSFFINIIVLTAGNLYFQSNTEKAILMMISCTLVVLEFTMVVLWNIALRKINCTSCGIRRNATSVDTTTKYEAIGKCTLDTILKTTGGDIYY